MRKKALLLAGGSLLFPFVAHAQTTDPDVQRRLTLFVLIYILGFVVTLLLLFIIARKRNDHDQK